MIAQVALTVGPDLRLPFLRELVPPNREAPSVPEVAVHKHGDLLGTKHEVGTSWQLSDMALPTKPQAAQCGRDRKLGACSLPFNLGHQRAALFGRHDVPDMTPRPTLLAWHLCLQRAPVSGMALRKFRSNHDLTSARVAIPCVFKIRTMSAPEMMMMG